MNAGTTVVANTAGADDSFIAEVEDDDDTNDIDDVAEDDETDERGIDGTDDAEDAEVVSAATAAVAAQPAAAASVFAAPFADTVSALDAFGLPRRRSTGLVFIVLTPVPCSSVHTRG
jgi:hypothetical protein